MKSKLLTLLPLPGLIILILLSTASAQDTETIDSLEAREHAFFIKSIYEGALTTQHSYELLSELIDAAGGHRMAGSENYARAAKWAEGKLAGLGWKEIIALPAEVERWVRDEDDLVVVIGESGEKKELSAAALGKSGNTQGNIVTGEVVAFDNLDSLRETTKDLTGKIVFLTGAFDDGFLSPFRAYGAAVGQRYSGPMEAQKRGAIACLIRSMTGFKDDVPHTGTNGWEDGQDPIPAMALSIEATERLEALMTSGPVTVGVRCGTRLLDPVMDNTVIGEIKGSEYPDEIILAGGHLDSWDTGDGAHDDGAGVAHAIEAFHLLLSTGYRPKRTWRVVLFANEENGLDGARAYARWSNERDEFHLAAIESDAGGGMPLAFSFASRDRLPDYMKKVNAFWPLMEPYNLSVQFFGSGADIAPLQDQGGLLIGLRPNPQRYFDYHHSTHDVLAKVHPRELSLGAAAIASLIYLIDVYGLD